MESYCLASSSSGNCYIFEFKINGMPTYLMVECGIPLTEIYKKCNSYGLDFSKIGACLITHAHSDHSKAAHDIAKRGISVFSSKDTMNQLFLKGGILEMKKPTKILDGLFVLAFPVEHDCDGSVGFVIKTKEECVIFINDHKKWVDNLRAFKPDYVFIESNYDHKTVYAQLRELEQKLDSKEYDEAEKKVFNQKIAQHKRNLESHCSLLGTLKGLSKLNLENCKAIFLMHLSDRYANEYRMKSEIEFATHIRTYVCKKSGGIK